MKPKLCIDIDNIIADTDVVMRQVIREYTGNRVRLERDDVIDFDYEKCSDADGRHIEGADWDAVHQLFAERRYLMQIQPLPGAIQGLHQLARVATIHIATSRLPKARKATIEWLERWCVPAHDLHFVQHKEKHVSLGEFAAAVEDHYEQADEFAKQGTDCFLIEHPWNVNEGRARSSPLGRVLAGVDPRVNDDDRCVIVPGADSSTYEGARSANCNSRLCSAKTCVFHAHIADPAERIACASCLMQ